MSGSGADDETLAVARAEEALADAHVSLDLDVIADLLRDDYVIVQPDGTVQTKAEVLASYGGGDRRWDKAAVDQLDIRVHGDTAVVIGRWRASGRNGAEAFDYQARFLSVWMKQGAGWKNVAYQSAEIL